MTAASRSSTAIPTWWTPRTGTRGTLQGARAPLLLEDRVDELALPFVLHPLVLDEVCLEAHAELLEDPRGAGVARLGAADHAVQPERAERERQQRGGGLGRLSVALVRGVEDEPELAAAVPLADPLEREVADDRASVAERDRAAQPLALVLERDAGDLDLEQGAGLVLAARVVVEPPCDALVGVHRMERGEVVLAERPQLEPVGEERPVRREAHASTPAAGSRCSRASARASRHQMSSYACSPTQTAATSASATIAGTTSATGMRSRHASIAARRPRPSVRATRKRSATYANR